MSDEEAYGVVLHGFVFQNNFLVLFDTEISESAEGGSIVRAKM